MTVTWKWVIYYTADALKSLYRRQYRTRTLKKATQKTKTLSSSKELTSWVKLQVEIFCKARLWLALQKISTCSLSHDVSSFIEDDNINSINLVSQVTLRSSGTDILYGCHLLRCLYTILYFLWLYNEFFIILCNILKQIAELDCCQIIILSIYVPSIHA